MSDNETWRHFAWDEMPPEKLRGGITRRFVSGARVMMGKVTLSRGDIVPEHAHHNEQITFVISGAMRFQIGLAEKREIVVRASELLIIPSNLPHGAIALEDTVEFDIFDPPREDWIAGTDGYLRDKN